MLRIYKFVNSYIRRFTSFVNPCLYMSRRLKDIGDWGEEQAGAFLRRQGFKVVDCNYFTTVGEIDIVARKGDDWYFIEVKTRETGELANDSAITRAKKFKFQKTVRRYCYEKGVSDQFGLIFAGLIVSYEKISRTVNFRLAVWRD